jgi:hypothetical protein
MGATGGAGVPGSPPRRPRLVSALAVALLAAGALELLGSQDYLIQARSPVAVLPPERAAWLPLAAAVSGAGGVALLAASAGLVLMRPWGWWLGVLAPPGLALARWALRLGLERAPDELARRPLEALLTLAALAAVWAVLGWPPIRRRFGLGRSRESGAGPAPPRRSP